LSEIKRLFPFLKRYRATIIMTLLLGVLLSLLTLATAQLVKYIIDEIFVKKNAQALYLAPVLIIGIYLFAGVVRFIHMYFLRYTGEKIGFDIRQKLQDHFALMSLDFHTGHASSSLLSKTINDVISIQQGLSLLSDVVREPLSAAAMLGYLLYVDWKLTLITLISIPILILASRSLGRSVRKYSQTQQEIWENVTLVLKETLDGIRVVKAFSLEKHMMDKFNSVIQKMLAIRRKILKREELSGPLFELLAAMTFGGILYYAGSQAIYCEATVGAFMSYVFVLGSFQGPIKKLQDAHVRLQHTIAATKRVFEILDTPLTVKDPEDRGQKSVSVPKNWTEIEFKNVHFSYGNKTILNGIDLKVKRGEVVAIVGSSGGGKTTLVNLIPRFYDVASGQILIGGVDIRDYKTKDLRSQIALVTQDVFLFNESIKDNILAGDVDQGESTEAQIQRSLSAANASSFVQRLNHGIESVVGDRGALLSGGERQRISIARALYKNTPILILDEATSALDSESEKTVQGALETLMKGRTTFVIAHRLSTIQKADRIIVLSEGKIVEEGRHDELLKKEGAYSHFHRLQFH
jgi:ATP-binding cassette subfamily B protein/subfamily B ATP-binding cassette protein MsbA